jgi:N-methylhydantoinase B
MRAMNIFDPIVFEMIKSSFKAMCTRASNIIERRACAPVITEGHDYCVSLLTKDGKLISHGTRDHGAHLGTLEATIESALIDVEKFLPGDVFVINDPYRGGTHLQDIRMIRPIFYENTLFAFVIAICHITDIGGPIPGSFNPEATDCFSEGLQLPIIKLYQNDKPVKSTFELINLNVRLPYESKADLSAQYQATLEVEKSIKELLGQYGKETIEKVFKEIIVHSEQIFKKEIAEMPDGVYKFVDYVDKDPCHPKEEPVRVVCKLIIEGEKIKVDWTETDPAPFGPSGITRSALLSATLDGTLHYFPYLNPLNHGLIKSLDIISTPGTATHVIRPSPVGAYCSGVYEKVEAAIMGCWAQVVANVNPTRILAGTANLHNCVIAGRNSNKSNYVAYMWLEGGQGARAFKDGPSFVMMTYAGGAANQSIEIQERIYPIRYTKVEAVQDSCGHGKFRGGYGLNRNFEMLADAKASVHGDREKITPYGLVGGTNGGPNLIEINKGTKTEKNLGMTAVNVKLRKGDHVSCSSNGGGGVGDPLEREPIMVMEDVIDGFLSIQAAKEFYGVIINIIDEASLLYQIDEEKTLKLRKRKKMINKISTGFGPWEVHPYGDKVSLTLTNL